MNKKLESLRKYLESVKTQHQSAEGHLKAFFEREIKRTEIRLESLVLGFK